MLLYIGVKDKFCPLCCFKQENFTCDWVIIVPWDNLMGRRNELSWCTCRSTERALLERKNKLYCRSCQNDLSDNRLSSWIPLHRKPSPKKCSQPRYDAKIPFHATSLQKKSIFCALPVWLWFSLTNPINHYPPIRALWCSPRIVYYALA